MFGLLLKKQLYEIFRGWFYNGKTGKARSKGGTAAMAIVFLFLMVILGGSFTAIAIGIARPMYEAGAGYLYFIIFGIMSVAFGLFGSVVTTYAALYKAKDNDLLLSMPIPVKTIVFTRLFGTYLMGVMYSAVVFVPASVVYLIVSGFNIFAIFGNIVMLIEISLIVWILSCLLGFAVAKLSLKLKNRSFVAVFASIIGIGLYYFVYFKAQYLIRDMTANAARYGENVEGSAFILYVWGEGGAGKPVYAVGCLAVCIALTALTWLILNKTFLGIATATPKENKKSADKKAVKVRNLPTALLKKEFLRFVSSANYMLNCGLGVLLIPAAGIALLIKGNAFITAFSGLPGTLGSVVPVLLSGIACALASINDSASPSISLEGETLWILKSLPVEPWQVIKSKIKAQLILTEIPMLFFCCCIAFLPIAAVDKIMCIAMSLAFPVLSAFFNVFIGLKMPIFNWTNEIVPIKQSVAVAIALFGGWGYTALLIGGYFVLALLIGAVSTAAYLGIFIVLTLGLCALLCRRLKTKGTEIFDSL